MTSPPSPIPASSWDLGSSNPCLEGKLQGKSPNSHCASPWELGAVSPCSQNCGRGAQCEIQLTLRCPWVSPVPATPSEPQLCPVSPAQSSRQIPATLGDHDSRFLLLHLSVFFLPLSCIPPQPLTFSNFSHLSFSSQNTPRGFTPLQFVLFSAFLDHPGPPAPAPVPHGE